MNDELIELMINSLQDGKYMEWEHSVSSGMAGTLHSYKSPDFETKEGSVHFFVDSDNRCGVSIDDEKGWSRYVIPRLKMWNPFNTPTNLLSDLVERMKNYHKDREYSEYEQRISKGLKDIRDQVK